MTQQTIAPKFSSAQEADQWFRDLRFKALTVESAKEGETYLLVSRDAWFSRYGNPDTFNWISYVENALPTKITRVTKLKISFVNSRSPLEQSEYKKTLTRCMLLRYDDVHESLKEAIAIGSEYVKLRREACKLIDEASKYGYSRVKELSTEDLEKLIAVLRRPEKIAEVQ